MVDRRTQQEEGSNRIKDPEDWTTGDEPMTVAQRSYLHTLAEEAGEEVRDDLTKAEASKRIEELQDKTGRRPPPTSVDDSPPSLEA
jgi:NTP pyrophosphatase (non-canonical NTP hydrolase)